jgi:hypothetical protein
LSIKIIQQVQALSYNTFIESVSNTTRENLDEFGLTFSQALCDGRPECSAAAARYVQPVYRVSQ